jgi:hypothetical protein
MPAQAGPRKSSGRLGARLLGMRRAAESPMTDGCVRPFSKLPAGSSFHGLSGQPAHVSSRCQHGLNRKRVEPWRGVRGYLRVCAACEAVDDGAVGGVEDGVLPQGLPPARYHERLLPPRVRHRPPLRPPQPASRTTAPNPAQPSVTSLLPAATGLRPQCDPPLSIFEVGTHVGLDSDSPAPATCQKASPPPPGSRWPSRAREADVNSARQRETASAARGSTWTSAPTLPPGPTARTTLPERRRGRGACNPTQEISRGPLRYPSEASARVTECTGAAQCGRRDQT